MTVDRRLGLAPSARLRWDRIESRHVLLSPERGMSLSASAAEIVQLCDGTRTADGVVQACVEKHADAPAEKIDTDVRALLAELLSRRLVVEVG